MSRRVTPLLRRAIAVVLWALALPALAPAATPVSVLRLSPAHRDDGFWTSILAASDGRVYMGLCTHGGSARMYVWEPQTREFRQLAMMQEAVREMDSGREPQAKLHSQILEDADGRLWFGTDMGHYFYFNMWDDPRAYPGGHLLRYDPKSNRLEDLGIPFRGAAIRHLVMDRQRQFLYAVTFPRGEFHTYRMATGRTAMIGRVDNWDSIARVMVQDDKGNIYGSFAPYRIFKYEPDTGRLSDVPVVIPHKEGPWNDRGHGHRENIWRNALWHPQQRVIYGLEMGSATLFRFDPSANTVTDLGQMVVQEFEGSRIVPYSSHGFALDAAGECIYYSAPAARPNAPMHLLSYNTRTGEKRDLGEMVASNGDYAVDLQGASVGPHGEIYFGGWIGLAGKPPGERREDTFGLVVFNPSDLNGASK